MNYLTKLMDKFNKKEIDMKDLIYYAPLDLIDDNPFQARREYDIESLAERILIAEPDYPATFGLMQVPNARLVNDDDTNKLIAPDESGRLTLPDGAHFQLHFGHRRLRAFRHLAQSDDKYNKMPVRIIPATDDQMMDACWSENHDRADLSEVEQAEMMKIALDAHPDWSQTDLANRWGLARSTVANRLRLLKLPTDIQAANRTGKLSERQCLALSNVAQLQAADVVVEWSPDETPGNTWSPPIKPQAFVEHVIGNNTVVSSNEIRDYAKRAVKLAGTYVPGDISTQEFTPHEVFEQPRCRGCQYFVHKYCLKPECVGAKMATYRDEMITQAVEDLGIPFSRDEYDFKEFANWRQAEYLIAAWKADSCEHLVLGWHGDGHAPRPYADGTHVYSNDEGLDELYSSKAGVALGCAHFPLGRCAAVTDDDSMTAKDPLEDKAIGWIKAAGKQEKLTKRKVQIYLADVIKLTVPRGVLAGLTLLKTGKYDPGDLELTIARDFIKQLWDGWGSFFTGHDKSPCDFYNDVTELIDTFGYNGIKVVNRDINDDQLLKREIIRMLGWWGDLRQHQWNKAANAAKILTDITDLHQRAMQYEGDAGDVRMVIADLTLAYMEVTGLVAAGTDEET